MKISSSQQKIVLLVSIFASFVAGLDGFIVNVALPAIERELAGGFATQQWVVNAYVVTLGALMLIAGSLSDMFGRRRILTWGLAGFGITSILCALAPDSTTLVISRALQGAAGALLVPSSLALIMTAFSGPAQGKAIGSWTAWTVIAPAIGPLIGGYLVDTVSWRAVFWVNVIPIIITLLLLKRLQLPESPKPTKVDLLGTLLCTVGLLGIVYAFTEESHFGWQHPLVSLPLIGGVILLMAFVWYEKVASHPMIPLSLFKRRNFSVGNIATTAVYGALASSAFLLTLFLQQIAHYSAVAAGLALLPVTILMFTLSRLFGGLSGKYGPRLFMAAGPIIMAIGFSLLIKIDGSVDYTMELLPGIILFGLGLSITVAPLTTAILGAIEAEHSGIASAINNAVSRIAGLVAIAFLGVFVSGELDIAGYQKGMIFSVILLVVGGVISAIGIQNRAMR